MWGDIAVGFGGLLVLGVIGFIIAWRGIERDYRARQQRDASKQEPSD